MILCCCLEGDLVGCKQHNNSVHINIKFILEYLEKYIVYQHNSVHNIYFVIYSGLNSHWCSQIGTRRVHSNVVYQEYISDRNHLHMNATQVML